MTDVTAEQVITEGVPADIQESVSDEFSRLRSGVPETPDQTELREELDTGPARDEQGRFAPKEGEPSEELILGKFRSQEELASAYSALEGKLGQQGSELGDLRKLIEERIPEAGQPEVALNQETVDWFDEQIDENPYGAAVWALQNDRSGQLYNRAMDTWYDVQPRHASAFERQMEMAQFAQTLQHQNQPLVEQAYEQKFAQAWTAVRSTGLPIDDVAEQMIDVANKVPGLLVGLQSGTPEANKETIENLYYQTLGRQQAGQFQPQAQTAVQDTDEARAAKLGAQIAVASSAGPGEKSVSPATTEWGQGPPSILDGLTFGSNR